jgi:hypothetical protein
MRVRKLVLLFAIATGLPDSNIGAVSKVAPAGILAGNIPPRSHSAMTGSEFAVFTSSMEGSLREQAILDELKSGNMIRIKKMMMMK